MDKISVIVPIYNVEKYLDKCVESIVNQTYSNIEIILVDDGSPDNCPGMCDDWAKKDSRIKVVHKENGGASSARNAGLDITSGKYVIFIDGDDFIEPSMMEIMHKNILIDDYDVCVCNCSWYDRNYNEIKIPHQERNVFYGTDVMINFLKDVVFDTRSPCTKLYKFSIILQNNIRFDEKMRWGEDYPFNYFYFKKVNKMIAIENQLYNYLSQRDGSITDGLTFNSVKRWEITKKILLAEKNNTENYKIILSRYASELACISRELLRSENKSMINACYPEIAKEVKTYYKEFIKLELISESVKASLKLMKFLPILYPKLYYIYLKVKHY